MSMISTSAPRARIKRRFSAYPALLSILLCAPAGLSPAHASENQNLPQFGDATSAIVSLEQERIIGQGFLRSLRAQAPRVRDPLM
jgi:predicted Zn-dependent protease